MLPGFLCHSLGCSMGRQARCSLIPNAEHLLCVAATGLSALIHAIVTLTTWGCPAMIPIRGGHQPLERFSHLPEIVSVIHDRADRYV